MPVYPRYLAGATLDGYDDVLAPLSGEHRWTGAEDALGNSYLTSSCQRARLGFLPELWPEPIVQVTASALPLESPLWHISFDQHTPQELITAVTAQLAEALCDDPGFPHAYRDIADASALPPAAGWTTWSGAGHTMLMAPDSLASIIVHRPPHPGEQPKAQAGWAFHGGVGSGDHDWHATFSHHTPHRLVRAFHQALTSPVPLQRHRSEIPTEHLPHLRQPHSADPPRWAAAQIRSAQGLYPDHGPNLPTAVPSPARPSQQSRLRP